MRAWLQFWLLYIKIGRSYWQHRHVWAVQAYLNHTSETSGPLSAMAVAYLSQMKDLDSSASGESIADQMETWLAEHGDEAA